MDFEMRLDYQDSNLEGMDFEMRLDYQDSNLDKQNQNLLCYHYTIVQTQELSVKKRCKDRGLCGDMQIFSRFFYRFRFFTHLTLPTNLYSPTRPDFTA